MPLQHLIEDSLFGMRIKDTVVIFVRVLVKIVIPEHRPYILHPPYIAVGERSHSALITRIADLQLLFHFQDYPAQAKDLSDLSN